MKPVPVKKGRRGEPFDKACMLKKHRNKIR